MSTMIYLIMLKQFTKTMYMDMENEWWQNLFEYKCIISSTYNHFKIEFVW